MSGEPTASQSSEPPALFGGDATAMADFYDNAMVPGLFTPWAEDLVRRVPIAASHRVLDVACGTGALAAILAARLVDSGGGVLGTDFAPAMVARAEAKGIPGATFRVGDAVAQPVSDGEFDGVTCQQGLQFIPDRLAALREMRRALRGGGWLAVSCWTQISEQPPFAAFATALAGRGWTVEAAAIGVPFSLFDPDELFALAERAGFGAIRMETVTLPVVLPPARAWADAYANVPPFVGAYKAATSHDRETFLSHVDDQLSSFSTGDGVAAPMTSNILTASAP
jgi:ubiquinone/menaquinone biosynthesis C-methylase UbiE